MKDSDDESAEAPTVSSAADGKPSATAGSNKDAARLDGQGLRSLTQASSAAAALPSALEVAHQRLKDHPSPAEAEQILEDLDQLDVTMETFESSMIGITVNKLRKSYKSEHPVHFRAKELLAKWKASWHAAKQSGVAGEVERLLALTKTPDFGPGVCRTSLGGVHNASGA